MIRLVRTAGPFKLIAVASILRRVGGTCSMGTYAGLGCEFPAGTPSCTPNPSHLDLSTCDTYIIGKDAHLSVDALTPPRKGFVLRKNSSLTVGSNTSLSGSVVLGGKSKLVVHNDLAVLGSLILDNGSSVVAANVKLSQGTLAVHAGASLSCRGQFCHIDVFAEDIYMSGQISCEACALRSSGNFNIEAGGLAVAHRRWMLIEACGSLAIDGTVSNTKSSILVHASFVTGGGTFKTGGSETEVKVYYGEFGRQTPDMITAKVNTSRLTGGRLQQMHLYQEAFFNYEKKAIPLKWMRSLAVGFRTWSVDSCCRRCDEVAECYAVNIDGLLCMLENQQVTLNLESGASPDYQTWVKPVPLSPAAVCPVGAKHDETHARNADSKTALSALCEELQKVSKSGSACSEQLKEERAKKVRDDKAAKDAMDDVYSLYVEKSRAFEQLNETLKVIKQRAAATDAQLSELQRQLGTAERSRDNLMQSLQDAKDELQAAKSDLQKRTVEVSVVKAEKQKALLDLKKAEDSLQKSAEELATAKAENEKAVRSLKQAEDSRQKKVDEAFAAHTEKEAILVEAKAARHTLQEKHKEVAAANARAEAAHLELISVKIALQMKSEELKAALIEKEAALSDAVKKPDMSIKRKLFHDSTTDSLHRRSDEINVSKFAFETKVQLLSTLNATLQSALQQESRRAASTEAYVQHVQHQSAAGEQGKTWELPSILTCLLCVVTMFLAVGLPCLLFYQIMPILQKLKEPPLGNDMQRVYKEVDEMKNEMKITLAAVKNDREQLLHELCGTYVSRKTAADLYKIRHVLNSQLLASPDVKHATGNMDIASSQRSEDNHSLASEGWQHVSDGDGMHPLIYRMDAGSTTSTDSGKMKKCFLPGTAFKSPTGQLHPAEVLEPGCRVLATNGTEATVMQIEKHPRKKYSIVELVTRHASLKVSADHPIRVPGESGLANETRQAGTLVEGDRVFVGEREQQLTRVRPYKEATELFGLVFDKDVAVEAFVIPSRGIQTLGEPGTENAEALQSEELRHQ